MSIWTEFNGELVLSGKEYDGKGFKLRSVWHNSTPARGGEPYRPQFTVFKDGKATRFDYDPERFYKELDKVNVPHGREGGTMIDILESKVYGNTHISFFRCLRDELGYKQTRDWVINFIKARQKEGWVVNESIQYGTDFSRLDRVTVLDSHQECALEFRTVYRHNNDRTEVWEETYKHDLVGNKEPKLLSEIERGTL